ncbi:MAG: 16S rRNA (cytosine(1402)-N(4))-methyltransferase RsmH [Deltaproteobacteria bacterium]|nr:16S rRNA (cytosine(1402)-N(4))-methyltransferase RsmH [Deltaproteobacteria bacterium]
MAAVRHVPVMLAETLEFLSPKPGHTVCDCTLGGAGHAAAVLERITPGGLLIGLDRDPAAIERGAAALAAFGDSVRLVHANYGQLPGVLESLGVDAVDGLVADLGLSTHQLFESGRGFSFGSDEPLDMRMDPSAGIPTAADLVNAEPEAKLADILYRFGEERRSRAIARRIAAARRKGRIETSAQLADIVAGAAGGRRGRIHPATRTFMALRIAVNAELDHLSAFLDGFYGCLAPRGRAVVIAFHSLEDRLVKRRFRELAATSGARVLTKKVVRPTKEETRENPYARSARLRAVERGE